MKRFLLRSIVRAFSALILFHAADIQAQSRLTYVPKQVIIKLDASTTPAEAAALRSSLGATVKQRYTSIAAELWEINAMTVGGAVDKFKTDPHVDYIEPNYILKANSLFPSDPRFGEMWGLNNTGQNGGKVDADIDAPEAWPLGTGGTVVVGDIDTGMDMDHVDLAANLYTNPGEIPGNHIDDDNNGFVDDVHGWDFVNNDNNPDDDNGHGTHTAGTIAAVGNNGIGVTGVCWSARIMPLKFLDGGGSGSTGNAILAVQYATRMGARLTNNSWGGGGFSQGLRDAIADAGNHGVLFVAAAGNASSNNDLSPAYPASYDLPNIIAVASTDRLDQRSGFSNFGLVSVDLGAPGTDILSTVPNNGYALFSGTSMATPHVSGAAALVWSVAPAMTGAEVRDLILSTVDPLPALAGKVATGGRLNLFKLLSSLDDVAPARVADLAIQSTGSTSVRLTWTATGDDGSTGSATLYDVRYSKNGIYWSNFNAAPQAAGAPHPQSAGKLESFEITGLDYNTKYFFALVVEDENRNRSTLSNLPTGTTLGAPRLEYSPASFNASLQTGGGETQHLMIRNSALGTLDFAVGASPSWIRVVPPSGRVNAGQSVQLDVVFDATHLGGGPYASNIVLTTNDVTQPAVPLPVTLQVTSAADISVAPASINFGTIYTGQCTADTVVVTNIGAATLLVGSLATSSPFSTTATPFSLTPGESRTLQVQFCPVAAGNASATLAIASNDPDHPVLNVALQGVAQDPPVISVSPSSLSADLFTGATQDQTLTVSNQGGSNLDFEISFEDLSPDALKTSVFGAARGDNDVRATGRPLSSAELKRIKSAIPHNVAVDKHGEIDRGQPSKASPHRAMTLERVLGANLEEVFGSTQNQLTGGFRSRGNLFTCTTSTILVEHRFFMNPFSATQMWFLVYEGLAQVGSYDLVSASNVTPAGPGAGWYSSGEIDVPMEEGRYYLIVASFEQTSDYFNELDMIPYPIPASFGELTAGAGWTWAPATEFPPFPVQDVPGDAFGSSAAYYQTLVTKRGVHWLSVDPETATVPAAGSTDVKVTFDAGGLFGGNYDANIHIASNDPVRPDVAVNTHLHVTGAADIAVSKTLLDYGPQFIGAAIPDTLVVSNPGTDVLTVNSIVSSHPDYVPNIGNFVLAPKTSRAVVVTFSPTTTGPIAGTLTINSDDPDEPVLTVGLAGQGVSPPVISVSPPSLSENLFTGGQASHTLTIVNSGLSNLSFKLAVEDMGGPFATAKIAPEQAPPAGTSRDITPASHVKHARGREYSNHHGGSRTQRLISPGVPTRLSASGLKVLLIHTDSVDEIRNLLLGFEDLQVVDLFNGGLGTPTLAMLEDYDAVVTINNVTYASPDSMGNVLADYVDQGGSVVMTVATFVNGWDIRGRFASGGYFPFTLGTGPNSFQTLGDFDPTHPIMRNVQTAGADLPAITTLAPGAEWVASWQDGTPFVATKGDRVVGVNVFLVDGGFWTGDIPIVLHNAVLWASGARWLELSPREGVVPSNGHLDVTVGFDAADLFGGNYAAAIHVENNDPLHPDVAVPATLHVTGAPDIDVSKTTLDYGPQFIGAAIPDTLVVTNRGTDLLVVSDISSSRPEYTVDAFSFSLAPRAKRTITVTFAPLSAGAIDGTLTITSNDADENLVTLPLHGSGVVPPVIAVTPSSFADDLVTGETSSHTMTISNTGASPLEFAIKRVKVDVPASVSVNSLRSAASPGRPSMVAGNRPLRSDSDLSTAPHARVALEPRPGAEASGPAVLVIQDYSAWGLDMRDFIQTQFGITAELIGSAQIAATDFSNYDLVITCGDQSNVYYQRVSASVAKFEAFVTQGGVVQYQLATQGDNVSIVGGVQVIYPAFDEYNVVTDAAHPIVQGLPPLLVGSYANHTSIANLRPGTDVITTTQSGALPTTVEYKYGAGTVIATGMTWEYLYNFGYEAGQMLPKAIAYSLSLQSVTWLNVTPVTGVVAPGHSLDAAVDVDAAGLYGGNYAADIQVLNNDPLHPNVSIPITLHVTGAPDISVTETQLSFGQLYSGESATRTVHIMNTGTDVLSVSTVSSNNAAFAPDVSSFSLSPQQTKNVVVTFSPPTPGSYNGSLFITSNDPDESPVLIALSGSAVLPPVVSLTPASLDATLNSGEINSQSLTIHNTGGSPLTWQATAQDASPPATAAAVSGGIGAALTVARTDKKQLAPLPTPTAVLVAGDVAMAPSWFGVVPASGTLAAGNSADLSANINSIGLLGGNYYGSLSFASNDPAHPNVSIPVHLHVIGIPDISLTPSNFLYFGNVTVGQSHNEILAVSNIGTDDIVVSEISSTHADFTPSITSFTLTPGTTRNVSVNYHPVAAGTSFGTLSVKSNDPDQGIATLPIIGQGTLPPAITVDPTAFNDHLATGAKTTHTVTISNNGAGPLQFNIHAKDTSIASGLVTQGVAPPVVEGHGGPDPYGYHWRDSNDPNGPVFDWVSAQAGSNVVFGPTGFGTAIPLGFTFNYYGTDYTTVGASMNGWLSFNGSGQGYPTHVPLSDQFAGAIAPYARALDGGAARFIRFLTTGDAPTRKFIIEYNGITDLNGANSKTFAVIFSEGTNTIHFQYDVAPNAPVSFGIESPDQTMGMGDNGTGSLFISPSVVKASYAIEFTAAVDWLTASPLSGSVPAGQSMDVLVTVDATTLAARSYTGELDILNNDPNHPTVPVSVTLEVDSTVTASGVRPGIAPTQYGLQPNRPNPFNPITTISYELPKSDRVKLVIYDVNGRLVKEMVSATQPAGRYDAVWDGRNNRGEPVASGVYFYRLVAGQFVQTRKMVLLK